MHLNVPEEKIPKIGMEFEFETDAYNFYNEYSKAAGFGIRKHSAHKDKNGIVLDRIFCCECQGHRPNDKRDELIKSHRPETRTGCEAMIKINGRYGSKYKRWTKKAKKNIVEGRSDEVRVEPSTSMNEDEKKKLIGVHYKELYSLYNQLTTRGALTTKTFEIAKKYCVKGIEEIDACLESTSFVRPTVVKSVVQVNLLSRIEDKQTSTITSVCEKVVNEDGQTSDVVMIKGWKRKEKKPIRSGKGKRSSLEKSQEKKKVRKANTSIENNVQYIL
ncbi:hypothetical protein ACS0TY_011408 [Phlomoides rotata]